MGEVFARGYGSGTVELVLVIGAGLGLGENILKSGSQKDFVGPQNAFSRIGAARFSRTALPFAFLFKRPPVS